MDIPSYLIGAIKGAGSAGVKYVVVEELPTTGEEGTIYLVPKTTSETDNVYNEYMYINNDWELIGDTQADLSNYQPLIDSSHKLSSDLVDDTNNTNLFVTSSEKSTWGGKQDALVSGTNIKTINNTSLLGSGNIDISGGESDANVYYLGKTSLYNTEAKALNLNELKKGIYILKQDSNNNKLWLKATYKSTYSSVEPTTQTLEINIYDDINQTTGKVNTKVVLNELLLYIDTLIDEVPYATTSGKSIGSLTLTISDKSKNLATNFKSITLKTAGMVIGSNTFEDFNIIQHTTIPTASVDNLGRIIQYIGVTDNTYTNGYFYQCVSDGQATPTYSWSNINVQSSSGDKLTTYSNYDASKTQVLKNINGTLTWVDE